jgi:Spy/CpxP family protein refolding chaperone
MITALSVGGLIASSTATLAQETNATPAPKQGGKKGNFSVEHQVEMMKTQLNLTEEQTPKVKSVIEEFSKAMMDARSAAPEDRRAKVMAAREDEMKKMKEILSPEQYQKFEHMGPMGRRGPGGQGGGAPKADAPKADSTK